MLEYQKKHIFVKTLFLPGKKYQIMSLQNGYPENKFVIRKIQYITPVAFPFSVSDAETLNVVQEID